MRNCLERRERVRSLVVLFALAIVAIVAQVGQPVAAASDDSPALTASDKPLVTISPFLQDVKLTAADAQKNFSIALTNGSQTSQTFHLSVVDFGSLDESGGLVFAGTKASTLLNRYGLTGWLKLQTSDVTVAMGQKVTVTATIANRTDLQPGGHYAAVIATLQKPAGTSAGGSQVSVQQQLTALILATKVGGEKHDLKLDGIKPDGGWQHLPQTVTLRFQNPGNVHVVPRGTVRLMASGVRQRVVAKGVINEDSSFVLPGAYRQLPVTMHAISRAEPWPAHYYLQVDYRYDGLETYGSKYLTIYFLNIPMLLVGAVALIVLGATAVVIGKQLRKHHQKVKKRTETAARSDIENPKD